MSSFRLSSAIQQLNDIHFFSFQITNKLKAALYLVLTIAIIILMAMLIDTVAHMGDIAKWRGPNRYFMQDSLTGKLYLPQIFNLTLWILLFILTKSRKKATYHNYGLIMTLLILMFVVNNYLIDFYSAVEFAKSGYMVFLAGFFLALPLHEQHKIIKNSTSSN